jgi:hypothetical protein
MAMSTRNGSTNDHQDVQIGWTGAFAVFLAAVVAVVAIMGADTRRGGADHGAPTGNKAIQASYGSQS